MVETVAKGTVRPLADTISIAEAERAVKQVQEALSQQQQQLKDLERFHDENTSLSKLVLELPDAVSHRIMVPFGKVAFFPGRLIHTNEFLVLLGEGHYAERSAKQTVEILGRRTELLDKNIAGAKSQIADLEAESNFATSTAEEAKAGLVEIREEFMGSSELQVNQASSSRITAESVASGLVGTISSATFKSEEDLEHDQLMARLSELELAEAARGDDSSIEGSEVDEDEDEDEEEDEDIDIDMRFRSNLHRELDSRKHDSLEAEYYDGEAIEDEDQDLLENSEEDDDDDEENNEDAQNIAEISLGCDNDIMRHKQIESTGIKAFTGVVTEHHGVESQSEMSQSTAIKAFTGTVAEHHGAESQSAPLNAFTGTVTEHHGADLSLLADQQVREPQPSRPISKFKMRQARGGK